MGTLKKFWMYFIMFIVFFLLITALTNFTMRDNYKDITNYETKSESPEIIVSECKAARSHGYIKGSVTNNTEELIPLKYLQINLYDEDGIYLGSEYKELKYFNPQETINFDINYNYNNVDKVTLNLVDDIPEKESSNLFSGINDEQLKIALPIAGLLVFYTILP